MKHNSKSSPLLSPHNLIKHFLQAKRIPLTEYSQDVVSIENTNLPWSHVITHEQLGGIETLPYMYILSKSSSSDRVAFCRYFVTTVSNMEVLDLGSNHNLYENIESLLAVCNTADTFPYLAACIQYYFL